MQLDHPDQSVRAIYGRDDCLPERIELMQFWADKIDELRDGNAAEENEIERSGLIAPTRPPKPVLTSYQSIDFGPP